MYLKVLIYLLGGSADVPAAVMFDEFESTHPDLPVGIYTAAKEDLICNPAQMPPRMFPGTGSMVVPSGYGFIECEDITSEAIPAGKRRVLAKLGNYLGHEIGMRPVVVSEEAVFDHLPLMVHDTEELKDRLCEELIVFGLGKTVGNLVADNIVTMIFNTHPLSTQRVDV